MSYETERKLIETYFKSEWDISVYAGVPVKYENVDFVYPENSEFVALYIKSGSADQITLGDEPIVRNAGLVDIQLFAPINTGTKTIKEIIDFLVLMFERKQLSEGDVYIVFNQAQINEIGEQENYYQINVSFPFRKDVKRIS
ncbi:DUF4128 domain-containing protein [bacterium]|nr:DUF4128 domain-containing protein [bacterium]